MALTIQQNNFHIGPWLVEPNKNIIKNGETTSVIEPKTMEVLCYLAKNTDEVVPYDVLIKQCWPHAYFSDNPVHKCVAQLRKYLGDRAKNPEYIKNVSKRGYQLIAPVKMINAPKRTADTAEIFWLDGSPYRGLDSYELRQQPIFFGREYVNEEIRQMISNNSHNIYPCLLVVGSSGFGKSSLVKAGIIPELLYAKGNKSRTFSFLFQLTIQADLLRNSLQLFIQQLCDKSILSNAVEPSGYIDLLSESSDQLSEHINCLQDDGKKPNLGIIFIDQLERLVTTQNPVADLFFILIHQLIKHNAVFCIAAMRSEYYSELINNQYFQNIRNRSLQYDLSAPTPFEIKSMVTNPAIAAGLNFEDDVDGIKNLSDDIIADALQLQNPLPLLSYVMDQLYHLRNEDNLLAYQAYQSLGGIFGALSNQAQKTYELLSAKAKKQFTHILDYLIQIAPYSQHQYLCKKSKVSSIQIDSAEEILSAFIDARLFHTEIIDDDVWVSISHECLIHEWGLIKEWIRNNRRFLQDHDELSQQVEFWKAHDKSGDELLVSKTTLGDFEALISAPQINLTDDELTFIQLSKQKSKRRQQIKISWVSGLVALSIFSFSMYLYSNSLNNKLTTTINQAEQLVSFTLKDLKQKLIPAGKLDLLHIIGIEINDYYQKYSNIKLPDSSWVHRITALNILGEVEFNSGNYQEAKALFQESLDLNDSANFDPSVKDDAIFQQGQSHFWLGYIYSLHNEETNTLGHWQTYLDLSQKLADVNPAKPDWQLEVSYALNNLGTYYLNKKNYQQAEQHFQQSVVIKRQLDQDYPNNSLYLAELADTISWQATIQRIQGSLVTALELQLETLKILGKLQALDENKKWLHRIAITQELTGWVYYELGRKKDSLHHIKQAIESFKFLTDWDPDNSEWLHDFINTYLLAGKVYRHLGKLDIASSNIQLGLDLYQRAIIDKKIPDHLTLLKASLQTEQNLIQLKTGNSNTAAAGIKRTIADFESQYSTGSNEKAVFSTYLLLIQGLIAKLNNQPEQSKKSWQQANKLANNLLAIKLDNRLMAMHFSLSRQLNLDISEQTKYKEALQKSGYLNPDYFLNF